MSLNILVGTTLPPEFYQRTDVVQVARELLGMVLVSEWEGQRTAGRITETEAYRASDDRACHAYANRRTPRTEVMFQDGGRAYIYLCYGIHHLFNVVTAPAGLAHAVLIRALEPLEGLDHMAERRNIPGKSQKEKIRLTTGPGALSQAMGLHTAYSGQSLLLPGSDFWIEDRGSQVPAKDIASGPRIGVDYAGECAAWPWSFWVRDALYVSKAPNLKAL